MAEKTITLPMLLKGIENCESYHALHEHILHELGQTTATDEAQHQRNLYRAGLMRPDNKGACKLKYQPNKFRASRIEDEFKEFRQEGETVVVK